MEDLFGHEEIRALSWKQPYGSLMFHGKIETRTWATPYRGLVLICTSQQPYSVYKQLEISGESLHDAKVKLHHDESVKYNGYAIGVGRLMECRPMERFDVPYTFVNYRVELFCHVYRDVKRIEPFPVKGSQGWFKVTDEMRGKIKLLYPNP